MFSVVLWDIDGTVLDFRLAERNALAKCFEIFGLGELSDSQLSLYSSINASYWKLLEKGQMTKSRILVQRYVDFFGLIGVDTSICEEFNREYLVRLGDTVSFCPHALEVLKELKKKGIRQCAVTNGTLELQKHKLKQSGLDRIFDHVFISEEVGYEKPSIHFFSKVFDTLGKTEKENILIVGDSLTSDIQGGLNAGIATCLYDPEGASAESTLAIDYRIRSLGEVPGIVLDRA